MLFYKVNLRMCYVLLFGVLTWFAVPYFMNNGIIFINVSPSLPRGIYMAIPGNQYRVGDIVAYTPTPDVTTFCLDRGYMKKKETFVKTIGAMPNTLYRIDSDLTFTINGKPAGVVIPKDTEDRDMPIAIGYHRVPQGEFLPYTQAPRSLDGRYTGTVPFSNIRTRVIPILTEWK